jgi:hypothetical protein
MVTYDPSYENMACKILVCNVLQDLRPQASSCGVNGCGGDF